MNEIGGDFEQMKGDADMAAQDRQIGVQVFDFGLGHMGVVEGLQAVKPDFQIAQVVFAHRFRKAAGIVRRFGAFDDIQQIAFSGQHSDRRWPGK